MQQPADETPPTRAGPAADPRAIRSADLLAGGREIAILHNDETYRLRLTATGKLILTK